MATLASREPSSTTITSRRTPFWSRTLSIASARNASPSLTGTMTLTSRSPGMALRSGAAARGGHPEYVKDHGSGHGFAHCGVAAVHAVPEQDLVDHPPRHAGLVSSKDPIGVLGQLEPRCERPD